MPEVSNITVRVPKRLMELIRQEQLAQSVAENRSISISKVVEKVLVERFCTADKAPIDRGD